MCVVVPIKAKMGASPTTPRTEAEEGAVRVEVDLNICEGHGQCNAVAPEVYDLDDGGCCLVRNPEVPPGLEPQAEEGALSCPVQAITVSR